MAENSLSMPSGFGGLMRYDDEYEAIINFKPMHVVLFVILIIGLRIALPLVI